MPTARELYLLILADLADAATVSRHRSVNAVAESFFATFKKQTVFGKPIGTRHAMRQQVFEFIEIYYNRVRRHSANGWVTPVEFEPLYNQNLETSVVH